MKARMHKKEAVSIQRQPLKATYLPGYFEINTRVLCLLSPAYN